MGYFILNKHTKLLINKMLCTTIHNTILYIILKYILKFKHFKIRLLLFFKPIYFVSIILYKRKKNHLKKSIQ